MRSVRVIPCLDVHGGRVVKGVNFVGLRDTGDPVELAAAYDVAGADELVFLDITASHEGRPSAVGLAEQVAERVFIPFTVGGGLRSLDDIRMVLGAGADKVSLNSAAIRNPGLIEDAAGRFGRQCVVVAIDAKRTDDGFRVFVEGGRKDTGLDARDWAVEAERLGAGEILLTSMDADGTRTGYDIPLTRAIAESVDIPVIASGGAGDADDLVEAVREGHADAVLVAGIVHDRVHTIASLKAGMAAAGIPVRIV